MAIPRAADFEAQVARKGSHHQSRRLKLVIACLREFDRSPTDQNVIDLKTAIDLWTQQDPKEFRNMNSLGQSGITYLLFFEVNAEFFRRGLQAGLGATPRAVFVPFAPPADQEFRDKSEQWNAESTHHYDIIVYDGANDGSRRGTIDHTLANMTQGHIFVRAHGSPGATHVSTRNGPDTTTASVEDVCRRLMERGLRRDFQGAVHFFCCYSGVDGRPEDVKRKAADPRARELARSKPELRFDTSCIARRGATWLKKHGFRSCQFFGYLGPLKAMYGTRPGSGDSPQAGQLDGQSHRFVVMSEQGRMDARGFSPNVLNLAYRSRVGRREFV